MDLSKQRLQSRTLVLLQDLAEECKFKPAIDNLFNGGLANHSELGPALHTVSNIRTKVNGEGTQQLMEDSLANMQRIVETVHEVNGWIWWLVD